MKKSIQKLILPILPIILNSCLELSLTKNNGTGFEEIKTLPPDKALIYYYREYSLTGAIFSWTIYLNEEE